MVTENIVSGVVNENTVLEMVTGKLVISGFSLTSLLMIRVFPYNMNPGWWCGVSKYKCFLHVL